MSVTALEKHPCPACGAQAEWNPGKQKLVCPFCGTESPYAISSTGAIEELDLVRALREMPDDLRGWQTERRTVQCRSCKAVSVFDPARVDLGKPQVSGSTMSVGLKSLGPGTCRVNWHVLSVDTHKTQASGPVISVSTESFVVSSATPMPGLMPPPMTCEDAAEVEPMVPRLDAG